MKARIDTIICFTLCLFLIAASGCMPYYLSMPQEGSMPQERQTMNSPKTYQPIDWDKWDSGLYQEEFIGKAVLVEGYLYKDYMYQGIFYKNILRFTVYRNSIQEMARRSTLNPLNPLAGMVSVAAPMSMRDQFYHLQDGQKIRIYGRVENTSNSGSPGIFGYKISGLSGSSGMSSGPLLVFADRIEKVR